MSWKSAEPYFDAWMMPGAWVLMMASLFVEDWEICSDPDPINRDCFAAGHLMLTLSILMLIICHVVWFMASRRR